MKPRARPIALLFLAVPALPSAFGQESAAVFDAPVVAVGPYFRITNLLDVDGDGLKDAVGTWYSGSGGQVTGWNNDGTGKLSGAWAFTLPFPNSSYSVTDTRIATGDFDLDGDEDFAVSAGGVLRYYLSNGSGVPTLWATVNEPAFIDEMVGADFDGDGRTDLAYLAGNLTVRLTQAGGPGSASSTLLPPGTDHALFVAQVEADGLPDVGVAGFSTGTQLRLYPISGAGGIGTPLAFTLAGLTMPMPASGDVDGDGDADVVVFGMMDYWVVRRTGPATFALESPVAGGPATDLADVDGDGDLDGVCCGGGGGGTPTNSSSSLFEIAINGGGVFAPAFSIQGLGATHIAGAVDLDADGDTDLVGGRCVYFANGAIVGPPASPAGTSPPDDHMVADPDGDGDPDLLFGLGIEFRNAADGSFASAPPVVAAAPPGTAFFGPGWAGDFDGDGDVDLVVEHRLVPSGFLGMRLLRNNGGGGLVDGGAAGPAGVDMKLIPTAPWAVATLYPSGAFAADADGDGDLDLVVRGLFASMVWWNDGTGFFTGGPEFPFVYVTRVANLDANPAPDLLTVVPTSAFGTGFVSFYRGLGGGAFGPLDPQTLLSFVHYTDGFDLADFDGDGDLDLAGLDGSAVMVRQNVGNGVFLPAFTQSTVAGGNGKRVLVRDLDGDGTLDLLVSPALYTAAAGCQIHLGTGAGPFAFAPPVQQMLAPTCLEDADGDGDLDGIGLALVKNRRFYGPSAGLRLQYGTGLAGTGGMIPTLGGVGPFRAGTTCETRVTGGIGGGLGVFAIGNQPANVPIVGGTLLTTVQVLFAFPLGGMPGVAGEGSATIPWVAPPSLAGVTLYQQVGILDPGAPQGVSLSNGLRYTIGQ
ncbi:MAG TPA: VCBS repeat-containing protein [Planctomycetota bacterium]|jgi:hypothetical protein|nr:VCBS repeat-containing protein [Planctomycetota bacterium]